MEAISSWFKRYTSDPQVVALALVLLVGTVIIVTMGRMLAPALAALVLAFLLEGAVGALVRRGVPRNFSVTIIFLLFLFVLAFMLFGVLPELSHQVTQLLQQLPSILTKGQDVVMQLPEKYPDLVNQTQIVTIIDSIRSQIAAFGQRVLSVSLASVVDVVTIMVYIVLVPVLIFFFLKDKLRIAEWLKSYLPKDRALTDLVWSDVNAQIGNYVRGKIWEIFIVGGISYITFTLMELQYAALLGTLVGLSVVIPYIGAALVTFPIAAIAYFQWGWSPEFGYVLLAYGIIQAVDGNILVPLLFSEVVDLHPIAIILSVLVFGGIWGVWGVFFAIPLATVVQAVLKAWPRGNIPHEAEMLNPENKPIE